LITKIKIGAKYSQNKTEFSVWAPHQDTLSVVLPQKNEVLKMNKMENGYWLLEIEGIKPKTRYQFRLNDKIDRPDPASHFQPEGVFGYSAVVDHSSFPWTDNSWRGIKLEDMVMYELHVGTFSRQGTFAGVKRRAQEFSRLGINAVELMPVSQFSGARNWGYDAVFPFAVQNTYGGPDELKKLVDEFHANGIAVILDVIYNHLGPEGNFLKDFGPYFLFNRTCPWGPAINFDDILSHGVRNFFLENAVHWFQHYHIDGLRLDAIFTIIDNSPKHFLEELSETTENLSTSQRKLLLIAEHDRVDPRIIDPRKTSGYGLDAVWHDDLHHSMHALLTGERNWYYSSFGPLKKLVQALHKEYIDSDQTIIVEKLEICSKKRIDPKKLVVFSQNHDQIGNRPLGERLITLAGFEAAKLAAGIVILSQYSPLLFMGEEYGEKAPFLFFTDFSDKALGKSVRIGRKKELKKNGWVGEPLDPQNQATFACSKIDWQKRTKKKGRKMLEYYQNLIELRKTFINSDPNKRLQLQFFMLKDELLLIIQKQTSVYSMVTVNNFGNQECCYRFPCEGGSYYKVLDSADATWFGSGSALPEKANLGDRHTICPLSIAVFVNQKVKHNG
jgi:maltooligosyltrehalose trehalohydrolase